MTAHGSSVMYTCIWNICSALKVLTIKPYGATFTTLQLGGWIKVNSWRRCEPERSGEDAAVTVRWLRKKRGENQSWRGTKGRKRRGERRQTGPRPAENVISAHRADQSLLYAPLRLQKWMSRLIPNQLHPRGHSHHSASIPSPSETVITCSLPTDR